MKIHPKSLKQEAAEKLNQLSCNPRKIVLLYAAVSFGVSLLAALMNLFLNSQVSQTGGLDGLEIKALWETIASVCDLAITFLTPIWSLGLVAVVLCFARGKDAQPKDLTAGFFRFGPGLGLHILTILIYMLASFAVVYIGTSFMSVLVNMDRLVAILEPFLQTVEETPDIIQDPAFLETLPWPELLACLWLPILLIFLLSIVAIFFISYRLRLTSYYLMDGMGPMQAIRKSFSSMKGNVFAFLRLDLSYWWYYGLMFLFSTGSLLDILSLLLNIPQVSDIAAIGIQLFSSGALCTLYWWKGAQVETTFALAYERLKN